MGAGPSVEDRLIELRMTVKQLNREAARLDKQERAELRKIKTAMERGDQDTARIHSESAIRCKNQALIHRRLAGRVDGVSSKVASAMRMQNITQSMAGVVAGMEQAINTMDAEAVANLMDRFNATFEDLDVQAATMDESMQQSSAQTTPADEVDALIARVAQEHGIEVGQTLPDASKDPETAELESRLQGLKSAN